MNWKKFLKFNWTKGGIAALLFILISFFGSFNLCPCKTAPVILNPIYKWGTCSMNVLTPILGVHKLYFGFEQGWILALVLNLVVAYLIACLAVYLYKKYKK